MFLPLALLSLAAVPDGPFIDVAAARTLTSSGAVVLDARGDDAEAPFARGAQTVDWRDLRDGWLRTGRLDDDIDALRRYFERRGVGTDRAVVVYGRMGKGWGEEGRIWWTLRYLGHPRVYIVDGGIAAWIRGGGPTADRADVRPAAGRFEVRVRDGLRADHRRVDRLRRGEAVVLDVRTREEYRGATPFWSSRGGHIPGARWLHWKHLLGDDGRVLPRAELAARFARAGVERDKPVLTYCTGGVRSAFVVAALVQAGFTAAINYDGSWWDWSRRDLPAAGID